MPTRAEVITDILDRHHRYLYEHMPVLDAAFAGAPARLSRPWTELVAALEEHLTREEEVLFPAMLRDDSESGDLAPVMAAMREEHEQIRRIERQLRAASSLAGASEGALLELLDDLAVHAAREDAELFQA